MYVKGSLMPLKKYINKPVNKSPEFSLVRNLVLMIILFCCMYQIITTRDSREQTMVNFWLCCFGIYVVCHPRHNLIASE